MDSVSLTYDWEKNDGRLAFVKIHWPYYNGVEVNQMYKLYYGNYLTSEGNVENVLMKVQQSTDVGKKFIENIKVVRTCPSCPVYGGLETEKLEMDATTERLIKDGAIKI